MTQAAGAPRILVADDDETIRLMVADSLRAIGMDVTEHDPAQPVEGVFEASYDLAVLDMVMPPTDGFSVRTEVLRQSPGAQFIMMTGMPDREKLERAIDLGVFMFLTKPMSPEQMQFAALGALRVQGMLRASADHHASHAMVQTGLVGKSKLVSTLRRRILDLAPLEIPILITGESGAGKEVAARCIHRFSQRSAKVFTAINCAGLSSTLIESELFGHVQGAFTGATKTRAGFFEASDHGTVFLDEIGDMPLELQSRLLRVLDKSEYNRVGETATRKVDVRVISATNANLEQMVAQGRFRADLYYRLRGSMVYMPPLRERKEDIPELVHHLLGELRLAVAPDAMSLLQSLDWPGNVRELAMVVATVKGLCQNHIITREMIESVTGVSAGAASASSTGVPIIAYREFKKQLIDTREREYFDNLVKAADGNMARAARMADMDRKNLYEKLKQLGIEH